MVIFKDLLYDIIMQENQSNNLKKFFIKLISISLAIIIIINVIFNLILAERLEKIDTFLSILETKERKNLKNELINELDKSLQKKNMLDVEDKIILKRVYKKIKKEFEELDSN
ncbi:MAG: hypothetical protein ACJZ4O_04020 [Pelagibacteraceae bacterium]